MLPSAESENRRISALKLRSRAGFALVALLVTVSLAASCVTTQHTPEQLTRIGFRSPKQTFETFQAALDYDLLALEYRCLSLDFKRRNNLSDLAYREFREDLARKEPFLRFAARAKVLKEWDDGPKVHWIEAEVSGWWGVGRRTARLRLVREDFWEIYKEGAPWLDGGLLSRGPPAKLDGGTDPRISASVRLDQEQVEHTTENDWSHVSEFRLGYEWKIDDLVGVAPEAP
jgi:hypothetical protein